MDTRTLGKFFIGLGIIYGMVVFVGNGYPTSANALTPPASGVPIAAETLPAPTLTAAPESEYYSASGEGQFMANGRLVGGR
jgi:hypothetical protein